jgi:hypothetical protein
MKDLKMTDSCDQCKKAVSDWQVIQRDESGVIRCYRGDVEMDPNGKYCSLQCALISAIPSTNATPEKGEFVGFLMT